MGSIVKSNTWLGRGKRSARDHASSSSSCSIDKMDHTPRLSSIQVFNGVASRFTDKHKNLVRSTGFGAFSEGVNFVAPDHPFTIWIMSKVDSMQRSLKISPSNRVHLFSEYVHFIFGLPYTGKEVWDSSLDKSPAAYDLVSGSLAVDGQCLSPSAAALHVLQSMDYRDDSSFDCKRFKIAVVVYLVCLLTDDDTPNTSDSTNFWPALVGSEKISNFNWSSFFLESVISSCVSCRRSVRQKQPVHVPIGVAVFLQVQFLLFYLFMIQISCYLHLPFVLSHVVLRRYSISIAWNTGMCLRLPISNLG